MKIDISKYKKIFIDKTENLNGVISLNYLVKCQNADLVLQKMPYMKDGEYFVVKNRHGKNYVSIQLTKTEDFLINL